MTELLSLIDEDYRHSWKVINGAIDGSETIERDGMFLTASPLPVAWINIAAVMRPLDDPGRSIDAATKFFDERGLPFVIRIREGLDPAAEEACTARGLPYSDTVPSLLMDPIREAPQGAADLDIRTCADERGLADFRTVMGPSFEFPPEMAARMFGASALDEAGCEFYVGYADGRPVACGALIITGRLAGVQIIGCLPEARRKGYGEAMTWTAVRRGMELGCDIAGLQASEMGRPIYERMGFEYVTGYKTFVRPGT